MTQQRTRKRRAHVARLLFGAILMIVAVAFAICSWQIGARGGSPSAEFRIHLRSRLYTLLNCILVDRLYEENVVSGGGHLAGPPSESDLHRCAKGCPVHAQYLSYRHGEHPAVIDPWGRPLRIQAMRLRGDAGRDEVVRQLGFDLSIWSVGQDGIDERGGGDDIGVFSREFVAVYSPRSD